MPLCRPRGVTGSNRSDLPPADAGEAPVAAALVNAVFDATGVRLRRAPLTPQRLKPALA
jgi:nicotinate dehydrogenase subunit B